MPTSELSPSAGTVSIMITLRIRGLYAAALTSLFRQYPHVCEVVQPDDEIQARLRQAWRMDSPDVTLDDQPDARGSRDTIRVAGPADAVEQVLQLLQEHCFDSLIRRESSQIGATYMGLVGVVSRARRRAVVYMGEQRAGILVAALRRPRFARRLLSSRAHRGLDAPMAMIVRNSARWSPCLDSMPCSRRLPL